MTARAKQNGSLWKSERHLVSPSNYAPEVRRLYSFKEPIIMLDFTIAKMDHLDGSRLYSLDEYKEVARLLEEAGVKETGFLTNSFRGTPKDDRIWEGLRAVAKLGLDLKLHAWARFPRWDAEVYRPYIDRIASAGADVIHLTSKSATENYQDVPNAVEYAKKKGLQASLGHPRVTLDPVEKIIDRLNFYLETEVDSLTLSDSAGNATPEAMRYIIKKIRAGLLRDVPIWLHTHDNFGMANAVALAATSAGIWPKVSANGFADRGFPSLEEVAMSLEFLYGVKTGIKFDKLPVLCHAVERISGISNPPYKSLVGEHFNVPNYPEDYVSLLEGKNLVDLNRLPYDLKIAGIKEQAVMTYSLLSEDAVKAKLEQMGLPTEGKLVQEVRNAIKRRLDEKGGKFPVMLANAEVEEICQSGTEVRIGKP